MAEEQVPPLPNYPPPPPPYGFRAVEVDPLKMSSTIIKMLGLTTLGAELTAKITVSDYIQDIINTKYQQDFEKERVSADRAFTKNPAYPKFVWNPNTMEVNMVCLINGRFYTRPNTAPREKQRHTKHSLLLHNLHKLFNQSRIWTSNNIVFSKVAVAFNSAANQVNQLLHLQGDEKIPLAWHFVKSPTPKRKLLQEHSMLGDNHEPDADYLPEWAQKIQALIEQGHDLNTIRDHSDPEIKKLYGMRSDAIRKGEIITFHDCDGDKHMVFPGELVQLLEQFDRDLRGGRNRFCPDLHAGLLFCQLGRTPKHGKKKIQVNKDDIFIQCPCIDYSKGTKINASRCKRHFNLSDTETYTIFKEMISKTPTDNERLVVGLTNLVDELRSLQVPGVHRIFSTCPYCSFRNKNEDAQLNSTGENPRLRHPSHVTCESCHQDYCADCNGVHPGQICDGFSLDNPEDVPLIGLGLRKCPSCRIPVQHGGGCSFMTCKDFSRNFCWSCLCIRHEEYAGGSRAHYCLLHHTFQTNPRWANDPNVITYSMIDRAPKQENQHSDTDTNVGEDADLDLDNDIWLRNAPQADEEVFW